jgi:hypothetical protein
MPSTIAACIGTDNDLSDGNFYPNSFSSEASRWRIDFPELHGVTYAKAGLCLLALGVFPRQEQVLVARRTTFGHYRKHGLGRRDCDSKSIVDFLALSGRAGWF